MKTVHDARVSPDERLLALADDLATAAANHEERLETEEWTVDEADDAHLEAFEPAENILSERATSMAGLVAKARTIHCIYRFGDLGDLPKGDSTDEQLAWSIVRDILAIGAADEKQTTPAAQA